MIKHAAVLIVLEFRSETDAAAILPNARVLRKVSAGEERCRVTCVRRESMRDPCLSLKRVVGRYRIRASSEEIVKLEVGVRFWEYS